jgi:outer membrane protein TolC
MDFSDLCGSPKTFGPRLILFAAAVLACHPMAAQNALSVDLKDALARARAYNPAFLAAATGTALAHEDRVQAKGALLPTAQNLTQYLYTQGNGTPTGVFVTNNGVHVYNEQAVVHADLYSASKLADYRRTSAAEAIARARQDIALRGLAVTVVQNYYAVIGAQRHLENARQSVAEAQRFFEITSQQEQGGEVAHTDVLKAQLQLQQRQRELLDAQTLAERNRLNLGVMLFPDVGQGFNVVDDLRPDLALPPGAQIQTLAFTNHPELRAAEAGVQHAELQIKVARGAYLPTLSLDYFFGISANQFAIHGPEGQRNLGSAVEGTLTVPIWNGGITRSKIRQAELQKRQAETELSLTRRLVDADVRGFSLEAQAAQAQLGSLRGSLDLAMESVRLTLLRYQAGESTALEVVDAQSALAGARNGYDDGLARYRLALANIEVLTGAL